MTNNDANRKINDDNETLSISTTAATNDDATAELNQAEMIEANQMMVVFDKNLVNSSKNEKKKHFYNCFYLLDR